MIFNKYADAVKRVGSNAEALTKSFNALIAKYEVQKKYVTGIDRYLARKARGWTRLLPLRGECGLPGWPRPPGPWRSSLAC